MFEDKWSEKIAFGALCDCFESLSKQNGDKKLKVQKLQRFFNEARKNMNENDSLFPILRLFLPNLDRERGSYGIKETLLVRLFIDLLKIGDKSEDAKRLKNYKAPKSASSKVEK